MLYNLLARGTIRVFNPYAPSNCTSSPPACYHRNEQEKRRRYDRRIRELERSSFLPVVLSATRGCGKGATALLKRIAHLQALRSKEPYTQFCGSTTVPA